MRRSLVLPIRTNETLCSFVLSWTAWVLPCMVHVDGSDVGIISCSRNAKRLVLCTTRIQPKSTTTAIDEINEPGRRTNSLIAYIKSAWLKSRCRPSLSAYR